MMINLNKGGLMGDKEKLINMRITSEMVLEWNGDSNLEELAVYLSAILNGEISLEVAKNEIADYFD